MTLRQKRFLWASILLMLVGLFKLYTKGMFDANGELKVSNLLIPFGIGVGFLIYTIVLIMVDKK